MAARPILSTVSIIILAGGVLLQLLVILSGSIEHKPISQIYFLQATTNGIPGTASHPAPNPARWTFFALCGEHNGDNAHCGKVSAAPPFDPVRNFGGKTGVPPKFASHGNRYYYLSRVMWGFYIVAVFFAGVALILSIMALCSRLAAKFVGLLTIFAVVAQAVTASLMTAWTYLGRHAFKKNGQDAKLGTFAYAFTWTAFVCFLISTVLFCVGGGSGGDSSYNKTSYFGRKKSTRSARSRGSFRDSESGRRVKDEYD